ncbi:MAG: ribonuclease III [Rhodocyclaceae bacterium]|nr:ribonuclease III [Rhodocyclaceae bacterium]MBX3668379.1 ribonuclease III [Rhodocyclaceae bacterium]
MDHFASLEQALGHRFKRTDLLAAALTHRSHSAPHNERLEFLGDGVLNCVVAALLYRRFEAANEGDLSRLRANLVRQETLFRVATDLALGDYLRLGEGELKSGGHRRPSILADALEAIVAAVYLDAGFTAAAEVVERLFAQHLTDIDPARPAKDAKTALQEWLQGRHMALPEYGLVQTLGEAHQQQFEVYCRVAGAKIETRGNGSSRRAAEQDAARAALAELAG